MGKLPTVSDARLMVILSSASTAAIGINSTWKPRPSFHYFIITECLLIYHQYFDKLIGCIMNRESKDLCFTTGLSTWIFVCFEREIFSYWTKKASCLLNKRLKFIWLSFVQFPCRNWYCIWLENIYIFPFPEIHVPLCIPSSSPKLSRTTKGLTFYSQANTLKSSSFRIMSLNSSIKEISSKQQSKHTIVPGDERNTVHLLKLRCIFL